MQIGPRVVDRNTIQGTRRGCPICKSWKVTSCNCLSNVNPKLARQRHRERNGKLTPKDVAANSRMKVWWRCSNGHEWQAAVFSRNRGAGCPYCSGRKVCDDNCLLTIRPDVAGQWHPTKNGDVTPKEVTVSSNRQVWWKCQRGHEWQAMVIRMTRGSGCPHSKLTNMRNDNPDKNRVETSCTIFGPAFCSIALGLGAYVSVSIHSGPF